MAKKVIPTNKTHDVSYKGGKRTVTPKAKVGTKNTGQVQNAASGKATVLKTICAKIGIDPKTARRILRKRMRSDRPEIAKFHTIKHRWVQDARAAQTIESVLREYAKAA